MVMCSRSIGAVVKYAIVLILLFPPACNPESIGADGPPDIREVSRLDELHEAIGGCETKECMRLVYFWSSSMPLSQLGAAEIEAAAAELGVPLVVAPGEALHPDGTAAERRLAAALIASGANVHYPSVVIAKGAEPQGNAVVGYRRAKGYRAILQPRLEVLAAGRTLPRARVGPPPEAVPPGGSDSGTKQAVDPPEIEIVWRYLMNPLPGAFYRRVPGTPYIAFDQGKNVYLRDVDTNERIPAPGFVDFVPTPDGRLFVTPGQDRSGLEFYVASDVIRLGRRGERSAFKTVFKDGEMTDQYPSVGILAALEGGTRYRVLTSKFEGLVFRDYEAHWRGVRDAVVTPVSPRTAVCPGRDLSTPMMSGNGREVAARDERTGTTRIFRIHDDGRCEAIRDLGIQTSKASFSDDRRLIAFSSPDGYGSSYTYVLDRDANETIRVPDSKSRGLVIPEMIGSDRLLFLAVSETRRKSGVVQTGEFRIACCIP